MRYIIMILTVFSSIVEAKCMSIHGITVERKFSNGEYLIHYRNGWSGLEYPQVPRYDMAVLKLNTMMFTETGRFLGDIQVLESKTTLNIDGFDTAVTMFTETKSCK